MLEGEQAPAEVEADVDEVGGAAGIVPARGQGWDIEGRAGQAQVEQRRRDGGLAQKPANDIADHGKLGLAEAGTGGAQHGLEAGLVRALERALLRVAQDTLAQRHEQRLGEAGSQVDEEVFDDGHGGQAF